MHYLAAYDSTDLKGPAEEAEVHASSIFDSMVLVFHFCSLMAARTAYRTKMCNNGGESLGEIRNNCRMI